jgi:hypothetical protein
MILRLVWFFIVSAVSVQIQKCDILVAGGSTAAYAAAISAAAQGPHIVCLTEPTSLLGGQLVLFLLSQLHHPRFLFTQTDLGSRFCD